MIVRIRLSSTVVEGEFLYFDLILNENLFPLPDHPYFGYYGSLNDTENGVAVLLTADGTIDLGNGYFYEGRFHKTNLRNKRIVPSEYVTIWWKVGGEPVENTFRIDAVTQISAVTEVADFETTTQRSIETVSGLPQFRARLIQSVEIHGFDDVVYRPPRGTTGGIALVQDTYVFYPDNAIATNGQMIDVAVSLDQVELIQSTE